jgi:hypothetical protein
MGAGGASTRAHARGCGCKAGREWPGGRGRLAARDAARRGSATARVRPRTPLRRGRQLSAAAAAPCTAPLAHLTPRANAHLRASTLRCRHARLHGGAEDGVAAAHSLGLEHHVALLRRNAVRVSAARHQLHPGSPHPSPRRPLARLRQRPSLPQTQKAGQLGRRRVAAAAGSSPGTPAAARGCLPGHSPRRGSWTSRAVTE